MLRPFAWKSCFLKSSSPFSILSRETFVIDDGLDLAVAWAWLDMDEDLPQISPFMLDHV